MPFFEIIDRPPRTRDIYGNRRAIRLFKVIGVSIEQILQNPQSVVNPNGDTLPMVGSWLPNDYNAYDDPLHSDTESGTADGNYFEEKCRLIDYTAGQQGSVVIAQANYSTELDNREENLTFENTTFDIPAAKIVRVGVTQEAQGQDVLQYAPINFSQRVSLIRRFRTVRIEKIQLFNAADTITDQSRNIHKMNGKYYRFEGADSTSMGPRYAMVRYSWINDPGFRTINNPEFGPIESIEPNTQPMIGQVLMPPCDKKSKIDELSNTLFVRPPFTTLKMIPTIPVAGYRPPPGNPLKPVFTVYSDFKSYDPEAYSRLPGINVG